jgi:hypothetical protein
MYAYLVPPNYATYSSIKPPEHSNLHNRNKHKQHSITIMIQRKKKKQRAPRKCITQRTQHLSRAALHQKWTFNRYFAPLVREPRGQFVYIPSVGEPERKEKQETKILPRKLLLIFLLFQRHASLVTIISIVDLLTNVHFAREKCNRRRNPISKRGQLTTECAQHRQDKTRPCFP